MNPKRVLGAVLAGSLMASCASLPSVERDRRPLATGSGTYLLNKKFHADREGGKYIYFSRFYSGSSRFFRSEVFTIQKIASAMETHYQLRIDLRGTDWSNVRSIVIKADDSVFRLPESEPLRVILPVGLSRFEERFRYRLDPALVASLRNASTIRIQDVAGPITLTPGQRSVLQSFLRDTAVN
jgi:hypothetical protein